MPGGNRTPKGTWRRCTAGDVKTQAERSRQVITTLQQDVQQFLPTWEGDARVAFEVAYAASVGCSKQLARAPAMLDEISLALERTAELIQQAEQAAAGDVPATITTDDE